MTSAEKVSGTHKVGKVIVADSQDDAVDILNSYAESIGLDLTLISQKDWDTTLRIALDSESGGIDSAKSTLASDLSGTRHGDAKQKRKDIFEDEYESIKGQSGNDDADDIFDQCYELAINGEGPNFTFGGEAKTAAQIEKIRAGWRKLGGFETEKIHGFHSYKPQDKAKAGKSSVGATLEKRKLQSDFLVFFGARKINAHVNVKE